MFFATVNSRNCLVRSVCRLDLVHVKERLVVILQVFAGLEAGH